MKRFFLILAFMVSLVAGIVFMIALPIVEKRIAASLEEIGFQNVQIGRASIIPTGLRYKTIVLDKNGFNLIEDLTIHVFWPTFVLMPQIDSIIIKTLKFSLVPSELKKLVTPMKNLDKLDHLSANYIRVKEIVIDVAADRKALRFNGDMSISKQNNQHIIKGRLSGQQYDISFNSNWAGIIDVDAKLFELNSEFDDLKINSTPLHINRGSGWFSYQVKNDVTALSGQFDAGSGAVMGVPANNISLLIGQDDTSIPILFRANASGLEDVQFTADFVYTPDVSQRAFNAGLTIPNMDDFLDLLIAEKTIVPNKKMQEGLKSLTLSVDYKPEKRFPSGPLPFDIEGENHMHGTILVYPDNLDVRGTIESDGSTLRVLDYLFYIPEENVNDNIIRLEGNIQSLFIN